MMTHSYKGWVIFYFRIYKKSIYIGGKMMKNWKKRYFSSVLGFPEIYP